MKMRFPGSADPPGSPSSLWASGTEAPSPLGDSGSEPAVPAPVAAEPVMGEAGQAPTRSIIGQVLPMYFVGDEPRSMAGDPIAAVNQGLVDLRDEVAKHPRIGSKVLFGIIPFADTAETRLQLSELSEDLVLPTLTPRGRGTSYASALEALRQTIPADVALLKGSGYQVHRPSVFFLSASPPTATEDTGRTRLH